MANPFRIAVEAIGYLALILCLLWIIRAEMTPPTSVNRCPSVEKYPKPHNRTDMTLEINKFLAHRNRDCINVETLRRVIGDLNNLGN